MDRGSSKCAISLDHLGIQSNRASAREKGAPLGLSSVVVSAQTDGTTPTAIRKPASYDASSVGEIGMVKKVCRAIAFGFSVMLVLTLSELPGAAVTHDRGKHQQRVKTRKRENRRRLVQYVCPMHPD